MRTARGFKGKYFSLQAITATVSSVKIQKTRTISTKKIHTILYSDGDEEEDEEETQIQ